MIIMGSVKRHMLNYLFLLTTPFCKSGEVLDYTGMNTIDHQRRNFQKCSERLRTDLKHLIKVYQDTL